MHRLTWHSAILTAVLLACALAAGQTPSSKYAIAGVSDDRMVDAFVTDLRRATARGDRDTVAAMIQYPIVVWAGGLRIPIPDAMALLARYDAIFTPALKGVIDTGSLTATSDGIAVGANVIWFKPVNGRTLKITAIRVPLAVSPGPTPAPGASVPGGRAARETAPRRMIFRGGQGSARAPGSVSPGDTDAYLVWAAAGSLLDVRIEGVPGLSVVLRVFDAKTHKPVDTRAGQGLRVWSGRAPSQGDYQIEVSHAGTPPRPLDYTLVVTRR